MTTTTRNEAAERLLLTFERRSDKGLHQRKWLDEALAAERRATVERIRARIAELNVGGTGLFDVEYQDILDEEAAR